MCEFDIIKSIPNWPGYLATPDGQIIDGFDGHVLHQSPAGVGYLSVFLIRRNKQGRQYVHRLILETYDGPCPDGMECRHLDGNAANNDFRNLRWGTHKENAQDMVVHGTSHLMNKYGELHPTSKLSDHERWLIHSRYHAGNCTQQELADCFGVSDATISCIVHNNRWSSLSN